MNTSGKVALVTGATRGIGKSICYKLSKLDMNLIITASDLVALKKLKDQLQGIGKGEVILIQADLTKEADIVKIVDKSLNHFGNIDILINNAGIGLFKRIDHFSLSDYEDIFNLNVKGVFLLTKYVVPQMLKVFSYLQNTSYRI